MTHLRGKRGALMVAPLVTVQTPASPPPRRRRRRWLLSLASLAGLAYLLELYGWSGVL